MISNVANRSAVGKQRARNAALPMRLSDGLVNTKSRSSSRSAVGRSWARYAANSSRTISVSDPRAHPDYALSSTAMSGLVMPNIACVTRCARARSSPTSRRGNTSGTICQETPNRSLSQPQTFSCPPSERRAQ